MSDTLSALYLTDPEAAQRLRRAKMAEALIAQGQEATPIRAHTQGLARMANALLGTLALGQVNKEAQEAKAAADQDFGDYQAGRGKYASPGAAPPPEALAAPAQGFAAPPPPVPSAPRMAGGAMMGGSARALNREAGAMRDAIMADPSLTPEQQQAALARVSEQRLVAHGTPPRPGAFGGARGTWDDGLPAPSGAVNPNVAMATGAGQPPAPMPEAPRAQPAGAPPMADLERIGMGLRSTNPAIRAAAEADYKIWTARQRTEAPEPLQPIRRPDGSTVFVPRSQAVGMVSAPEQRNVQTVQGTGPQGPGTYELRPDGSLGRMVAGAMPQQPPQPEAKDRYLRERQEILNRQAQGQATREDMDRLGQLEYLLTPPEQVVATPGGGVSFVGARPLPGAGSAPAGNTLPMGGAMQPGGVQPGPLVTSPVQDASGLPPVGARQGIETVSPGGRPVTTMPAPAAPPANFQRSADPSQLEPISGGPADPATIARQEAAKKVAAAEAGTGRVLDAINNFRLALQPFQGKVGLAAFNPQSVEGQRLVSAYELLKMSMRDESLLNTGVLQPGENRMLENMLRSPTSVSGLLTNLPAYNKMLDEFAGFTTRGANRVRAAAGLPEIDWSRPREGVTPDPRAPIQVRSVEEARRLPKGTRIILPDGSPGVVP